jgi:hypothetical protein
MDKENELYWGDQERIKRNEEIRKLYQKKKVK